MVYAQPRNCQGGKDAQTPLGFWHTSCSHSNSIEKPPGNAGVKKIEKE